MGVVYIEEFASKEKGCCFTGHRIIPRVKEFEIIEHLDRYVKSLVENGVKFFYVGGAIGFDTLVATHLLYLKDMEKLDIMVILICPFEGFTSRWKKNQQQIFNSLLPRYDRVIYKEKIAGKEAYLSRNRYLMDHSAYCIAYCTRNFGGTAYTIRYAMSNAVSVLNMADFNVDCL